MPRSMELKNRPFAHAALLWRDDFDHPGLNRRLDHAVAESVEKGRDQQQRFAGRHRQEQQADAHEDRAWRQDGDMALAIVQLAGKRPNQNHGERVGEEKPAHVGDVGFFSVQGQKAQDSAVRNGQAKIQADGQQQLFVKKAGKPFDGRCFGRWRHAQAVGADHVRQRENRSHKQHERQKHRADSERLQDTKANQRAERHRQTGGQAEVAHPFPDAPDGNDVGHDRRKRCAAHAKADADENAQKQKQGDMPGPVVACAEYPDSAQRQHRDDFAVFRSQRFPGQCACHYGCQRKQADDQADDEIVCLIRLLHVGRKRRRLHLDGEEQQHVAYSKQDEILRPQFLSTLSQRVHSYSCVWRFTFSLISSSISRKKASFSGEIPAKMSAIALASAGMAFSIHSLPFGVSVMR